nr:MAG TPA: adenine-specific methyltransferase [Caudoviricetes sp.]
MIINLDCLLGMRTCLADNSIDAVVTDPPYGLSKEPDMMEVMKHWINGDDYVHTGGGFMGKSWDSFVPGPSIWKEVFRVLKPGGHLLAFFGSRTYDLGTLAIRLAGFEIRDQIMWVYGSGFPKSLDVSKAIDKAAGVKFDAIPASGVGFMNAEGEGGYNVTKNQLIRAGESTDEAKQWSGWGTALKPAHEPICVARKPLSGTVAENVLEWGTGAINIDGCRVPTDETLGRPQASSQSGVMSMGLAANGYNGSSDDRGGRWPANFVHDGLNAEEWSRYFYCAKASKADRDDGVSLVATSAAEMVDRDADSAGMNSPRAGAGRTSGARNDHPTVKPTALMQWLVRLVTPPGGTVLDPFTGSGSTGKACALEGFEFIGFEMDPHYCEIAEQRIAKART